MPPKQNRSLSTEQGYELARVGTKMGLPVDLQRLIWADVTKNYYSRGSVIDRAATVLQVAVTRFLAILKIPSRTGNGYDLGSFLDGWAVIRFKGARKLINTYRRRRIGSRLNTALAYN